MLTDPIEGLIAAPFTAFKPDGALNTAMVRVQANALTKDGVKGVFINGTTGEGLSLTVEERKHLAETWLEFAGELLVIVHVGHASLQTAQDLASHAQKLGAHAVAAMPASYFQPPGVAAVTETCRLIASAAPELPFFYYHIPSFSGVHLSIYDLLQAVKDSVPTFRGVKFTHTDLMDFARCLRFEGGRYDILFGRDEILLSALVLGAKGAVGSTYNFLAPSYLRLIEAFDRGDLAEARQMQGLLQDAIASFLRYPGLPAQKALMGHLGQDLGPVRPPLKDLSHRELAEVVRDLDAVGLEVKSTLARATS